MSSRWRRSGPVHALILVAFAILAPGCAAATDAGNEAGGASSEVRREDSAPPTTPSPSTSASSPEPADFADVEPPGGKISYRGKTVKGELGSFCWMSEGFGQCVDGGFSLGDWPKGKTLGAPSGAALTFVYQGDRLNSLDVTARRGGGGTENLRTRLSGTRARIAADLPPGEYHVEAFATMPEGDATYAFGLVVEN